MPKQPYTVTIEKMLRVMRLVNDLAPEDPLLDGDPLTLEEFAARLGMSPKETVRYIDKINLGCGDNLPGLYIDYDPQASTVTPRRLGTALDRPLRLTAPEARALLAALETVGIAPDDPLSAKIEGAFPALDRAGIEAIEQGVPTSEGTARILATMTRAAEDSRAVVIRYRGLNDERPAERTVEPLSLSYDDTEHAWYIRAWCRSSQGWRTFRLDRISSAEMGEACPAERRCEQRPHGNVANDLAEAPQATLAVHRPSSLSDAYTWRGLERLEEPDARDEAALTPAERENGAFVATIPWFAQSPWLARMVAQTGGGVEVLHPLELREQVAEQARRLLALFR